MEHPFIGDLSSLSIEELTDKISKLNKSMSYSARTGRYDMANQIQMALENYRSELNKQQRKLLEDDDALTGSIDIS